MPVRSQYSIQPSGDNLEIPTLINACSKITGDLVITTDMRIDGKVFGKVESERNIIIGSSGYVKGFLRASNLDIFGRIEGNIIISGITILHPGSSIFGCLYTKKINVLEGAVITARVTTYDKLEPFDEAQINLAEEMYSMQSSRMGVKLYPDVDANLNQQNPLINPETIFDSKEGEEVSAKEICDETAQIDEIVAQPSFDDTACLTILPFSIETEESIPVSAILSESVTPIDLVLESNELNLQEELIDELPLLELTIDPPADEIQPAQIEPMLNPKSGSSIFASLLNQSMKKEEPNSQSIDSQKIKTKSSEPPVQSDSKSKAHSVFGFEELRNLLISAKEFNTDSIDTENSSIKNYSNKVNDSRDSIKINESENIACLLNYEVDQLPTNDYL